MILLPLLRWTEQLPAYIFLQIKHRCFAMQILMLLLQHEYDGHQSWCKNSLHTLTNIDLFMLYIFSLICTQSKTK